MNPDEYEQARADCALRHGQTNPLMNVGQALVENAVWHRCWVLEAADADHADLIMAEDGRSPHHFQPPLAGIVGMTCVDEQQQVPRSFPAWE